MDYMSFKEHATIFQAHGENLCKTKRRKRLFVEKETHECVSPNDKVWNAWVTNVNGNPPKKIQKY